MSENYSSYSINTNGITLSTGLQSNPKTPEGLLVSRAVETKNGWVAQILVNKEIIWEGKPKKEMQTAQTEANQRIADRVKELFS